MTIQEVKEKANKLEADVKTLLDAFYQETGCNVTLESEVEQSLRASYVDESDIVLRNENKVHVRLII